ncbi:MAG TPA: efflux RND transporter periplasmic adaptor subunit [Candidatus Acidoferrales bacterium]|nr:efflux RND transporter periplasmic adaptor subunit [Candidatus Acidoferrales bacterium]
MLRENHPRTYLALALASFIIFIAGCGETRTAAESSPPPAAPTAAPATVPQTTMPMVKTENFLSVSGPLIVEHQVDVTAQRDGVIASISADVNKHVKAGDELARLDDRELSANLEAARAKTRSTENDLKNWQAEAKMMETDYSRAQKLYNEGIWSVEQLDHAKYNAEAEEWDIRRVTELLASSKQEERSLELELDKARITAPFDGVVARRYIRMGQGVSKGDRTFWVTAEGPLRMRFTLPEALIGHLRTGQELALTSPDVPEEHHLARVVEISPVVDPSSGTIEVLAEIQGARGRLRAGMTASIRIPDSR